MAVGPEALCVAGRRVDDVVGISMEMLMVVGYCLAWIMLAGGESWSLVLRTPNNLDHTSHDRTMRGFPFYKCIETNFPHYKYMMSRPFFECQDLLKYIESGWNV